MALVLCSWQCGEGFKTAYYTTISRDNIIDNINITDQLND